MLINNPFIEYTQETNLSDYIRPEDLPVIKNNKKIEYYNLPCSFDIETTSTIYNGEKVAFMYIWAVAFNFEGICFRGRTWDDFNHIILSIADLLETNENKRLVMYVHNLGYEFQFMRTRFNWNGVFSVSERKPIKALCDLGIEFRDSYILSGFSLANTAKNLQSHKIKKLEGDLDYSLIRTQDTPLTPTELDYLKNDVLILIYYISEQLDIYENIDRIPLTNTGRVRQFVKNSCYYTSTSHKKSSKSKFFKYRQIMKDLTITKDVYIQLKRAFMGGFTHANANYNGALLEDVSSIDFTSSYPSVMVSEKFPMSRFKPIQPKSVSELDSLCSKYAVVMDVKFINIECSIKQETYLSESKCSSIENCKSNNGRIYSADSLITTLTEVDFDIMKKTYKWEDIQISNVNYAHKGYLPKSIITSILKLYQDKTMLKGVKGSEVEYLLSKGMLNSIYGMCVTDIVKDEAIYSDEWSVDTADVDEAIDKYNKSKTRFLYYAWGIWVTAYARKNLWSGILAVGNDYIYSDTDSLKLFNYEKHTKYIDWFDKTIINKMLKMTDYYKIDPTLLNPKTIDGVVKMIGVWDYEGTYSRFKTLGAKRYMTEHHGKLEITIAGLSKQNGINYMLELSDGDNTKVFKHFSDSLFIPADKTGKMTHTYIDTEYKINCTDYKGNKSMVIAESAIHLENCEFTLSISKQYQNFLEQLSLGYIFNGVKEV